MLFYNSVSMVTHQPPVTHRAHKEAGLHFTLARTIGYREWASYLAGETHWAVVRQGRCSGRCSLCWEVLRVRCRMRWDLVKTQGIAIQLPTTQLLTMCQQQALCCQPLEFTEGWGWEKRFGALWLLMKAEGFLEWIYKHGISLVLATSRFFFPE